MDGSPVGLDRSIIIDLMTKEMPYGKYKGLKFSRLPEPYLAWMSRSGAFPQGRLGVLLQTLYEIKLNGLEHLLNERHLGG
ncbi:MAG: DUF3820 family protein [Bacteroidales bacterium]|nr:DUF3820 family protein [Bacteroidales bacterium]